MEGIQIYAGALPEDAKEFYMWGVLDNGVDCIQVSDEEAEFYSVYAVNEAGLSSCIADLPDRQSAEDLTELLGYVYEINNKTKEKTQL